jgi:hypothetical protein
MIPSPDVAIGLRRRDGIERRTAGLLARSQR